MKKWDWKRLGLGFTQHAIIMCIMLLIAGILFNSYITVQTGQGRKIYALDPLDTNYSFEDSGLYHDLLSNAIGEVINLVVLKGELETNGYFDPEKIIDVSAYANRKVENPVYRVSSKYRLEDLIKWGRFGLNYTERVMTKKEFLSYYDIPVTDINYNLQHFGVDEFGQLYFKGFYLEEPAPFSFRIEEGADLFLAPEQQVLVDLIHQAGEEKLRELAFTYIMDQKVDMFSLSKEENGQTLVHFPMLNCRYENVDGIHDLVSQVDNWVDYAVLQNYLVESITSLYENYEQYRISNSLYAGINTNLKYCVRLSDEQGEATYSNISELVGMTEDDLTEYFSEFKRYLIYYPDDLAFSGNTNLTEADIYDNMNAYSYAFPETTHIWMGIDTDYAVAGDAFYNANEVYERVVPNVSRVMLIAAILLLLWVVIWVYLSMTTGVMQDEDGNSSYYLFRPDHIWTELVVLVTVALGFALIHGLEGILDIAAIADVLHLSGSTFLGINVTRLYEYGTYGLFGFSLSLVFCVIWYSLVRRIRYGNLWRDSIAYYVFKVLKKAVVFILDHSSVTTRILIPYNFFLLVNLVGVFTVYKNRDNLYLAALIIAAIVIFDGAVGIYLFKQNAERNEIVEGINRIRSGEVDYKVDVENLHGANLELADAVNNIGEGIRIAVKTSMKDEQMKTDLITNVSHDIKTPLTSIISYVDLLKRLKLEQEPAKSYIQVLDVKSQRLKQLTDDLVEASKISSGNITLKKEMLNLTELVNQAIGEFSEKLEDKGLTTVFPNYSEEAYIYADSRRMWRVIENLFNNVCKYALENTRVYIDLLKEEGKVQLSIKNISACQMNIKPDELTERFIRGDSARSTEGSGLGLSIAKSLTQVQAGNFEIYLDGDLFKVTLCFPEYEESAVVDAGDENAEDGLEFIEY